MGACSQSQRPGCAAKRLLVWTGDATSGTYRGLEFGQERLQGRRLLNTGKPRAPAAREGLGTKGRGLQASPSPPPGWSSCRARARLPGLLPSEAPGGPEAHWLPGSTSRALPPQQVGAPGQGDLSPPLETFPTSKFCREDHR